MTISIKQEAPKGMRVLLDFSGIETFVSLAQQAKLDTTTLDSLLRTEPYQKTKEWFAKGLGFQEKDLKTLYYHALYPELYQLGPVHSSGDFVPELVRVIVENMQYVATHPAAVATEIRGIKAQLKMDGIIKQAQTFLSNRGASKEYKVYFITGLGQGVAEEDYIIMDISKTTVENISRLSDWFAHELFHLFRQEYSTTFPKTRKFAGLYHVLLWLENEGIAELTQDSKIEKEKIVFCRDKLSQFNDSLKIAFENNIQGDFDQLTNTISNVQAHKIGHVMASTINEQLGKDELSGCVGNPISFFNTYQKAATKANDTHLFIFSRQVIDRVNNLEWISE